jgi:prepilin signal peptidase PulO-like enzyme (type II secretory pathway)
MVQHVVQIVIAGIAFGLFAYAGSLIAHVFFADLPLLADGPAAAAAPIRTIVAISAIVGTYCAARDVPPTSLAIIAMVCAVMTAIWCTDMGHGIVPDALTLFPRGAVILANFLGGHWFVIFAAAVPAIPFAFLAWRTKGLGMGWGDVKLAALGGALVGMQDAMLVFALAGVVAVIVTKVRGNGSSPLAFAPYLAAAIVVPLVLRTAI